ncbi:putative reverse transcriptase domain-containing protein [Tanacetum coccineum]
MDNMLLFYDLLLHVKYDIGVIVYSCRQDLGFIPSGNVVLSSTYVGKILGADQLLVILCYRYQESGIGYWILSMTISRSGVTFLPSCCNGSGVTFLPSEHHEFYLAGCDRLVSKPSKTGGSWKDNKKAKRGTGFVATASFRNEVASSNPRHVAPVNAVRMSNNARACYECGSFDHLRNTCPKGRAYNVNVNAMEAVQDPNVVTGTFSLNDHFVTILFDSGADFSFISFEFAPLLNVRPSIVNPGYVIEVADGKKVEVDRIFCDCKLELGGSLFSLNLIPLGHGSFDVIVGMDWLSQHKAVIICHEKVVEIPVDDGRIIRVHGERAVGIAKALKSAKEDEPKLNDISVV